MKRILVLLAAGAAVVAVCRFLPAPPAAPAQLSSSAPAEVSVPPIPPREPERPVITGEALPQNVLWEKPAALPAMAAFQRWTADYAREATPEKVSEGVKLAESRRSALKELIRKDPEEALANAVPEAVRRSLPAEIQARLETKVDARGDLIATGAMAPAGTPPSGKSAVSHEAVLEDGRHLEAFVYGNREFQPSRANVPIHGIALDGAVAVSQWPGRLLEPVEQEEAKKKLPEDPLCPVSQQSVSSTGTETAVLAGTSDITFYCGRAHAQQVLNEEAVNEAIQPPGFNSRPKYVPQNAASGGAGQSVPSLLSEGDHAWTTGTKRILVVRVKFRSQYGTSFVDYTDLSTAECEDIVDGIRNAYNDWSYGRLNVLPVQSGGSRVTPFVNLDTAAAEYEGDEIGDIWDEVEDRVEDDFDIDPDNYDFILVLAGNAPITDEDDDTKTVWWGGLGRIGEGLSFIRVNNQAWTSQKRIDTNVQVSLHELGHNLGLSHSSNIFSLPQLVDGLPSVYLEYGDRYDRMGSGGADFNVRYKQWLNWLDNSNVPVAATDGVFTIREHDLEEKTGIRGLQVGVESFFNPLSGLNQLFVEYRLHDVFPISSNSYTPYNDTLRAYGAQIRLGKYGSPKTWLLDTTPETPNWEPLFPNTDDKDISGNLDAPLLPGRTYSLSRDGSTVYITNLSADPDIGELKVEVQHGPIAGNDPPAGSITTNTPQGASGQYILFTANVTDPEDSDLAYHWQIPGFDADAVHPAVFLNARSIYVKFPSINTWLVKCLVSDKHGGTVALSKVFSVVQNQPPTIGAIADQTINEDASILNLPFTVSDPTTPAGNLTVTYSVDNAGLFPGGSITLGGSGGNRTISLVPPANRHGEAVITLQCSDGVLSDLETFKVTVNPVTPGTTLFSSGASWRYWDQAAAPPTGWEEAGFNDSTWPLDNSRFVYPAPLLSPGWTVLSPSNGSRLTCYFRRSFLMPAIPPGTPVVRFICDDGLVLYNNGVEIWRYNMPDGTPRHTTRAASSISGSKTNEWITVPLSLSQFVAGGLNTLAVEVHDAAGTRGGGDVAFDLQFQLLQTPTVSSITDKTSLEDTLAGAYSFTASDAETPAGAITFSAVSSNQDLLLDANIKISTNIITGAKAITAMPQPNATGVTEITYKVSDGSSETWRKFNLTILPVNDAPVISPVADVAMASGELAPLVEVQVADVDHDPAGLTVTATSSNAALLPNQGIHVLPGSTPDRRLLRLSPTAGLSAQTNITVTVSDGAASSSDVFVFRVSPPLSTTSVDVKLVQSGESWRYWAGTLPIDLRGEPVDFTDPALDDRAWPSGPSQLGYGNDGEVTPVPVVPYRVTTYFRKRFTIPNAASVSQLKLRMLRDDGAVVYLNGQRVWTSNMPRGAITATTLADSDISGNIEDVWQSLTVPTTGLVSGSNTIAVELHQSNMPAALNPGDLTFDFEMDGVPATPAATDVLVAPGEMWAYWDQELYPDSTWRLSTYSEEGWKHGLARLGYGIGGESTVVNKDNPAGNGRNPSVLFRKVFDVADPSVYAALHLFTQRDDGIAVHLNGVRVHIEHITTADTLSSFADEEAPAGEQTLWRHYLIDPKRLISGRNLLAVEIHQAALLGTDLNFDLQLSGELNSLPPLYLTPKDTTAELAWPASYNGWFLKSSTDLINWSTVPEPQLLQSGWIYVDTPANPGRRFFKLEKP